MSTSLSPSSSESSECTACPLDPDRRAFLRQASLSVGGVLLALGVAHDSAQALSLGTAAITPLARNAATRTYPIPSGDSVNIDRDNKIIIVRWLDVVYAFALTCPHQNTPLTWLENDERFQCPKHRSQYSPDGYFITGRATRGMDRYAVRRDGNTVVVDLDVLKKESDDAAGWKAACIALK